MINLLHTKKHTKNNCVLVYSPMHTNIFLDLVCKCDGLGSLLVYATCAHHKLWCTIPYTPIFCMYTNFLACTPRFLVCAPAHTNQFDVRACTHQPVWCGHVPHPNFFGVFMYAHQKLGVHEVNSWCAFRLPLLLRSQEN